MNSAHRLRMFAGPNGSGKSTIKSFRPAAHHAYGADLFRHELELQLEAGRHRPGRTAPGT